MHDMRLFEKEPAQIHPYNTTASPVPFNAATEASIIALREPHTVFQGKWDTSSPVMLAALWKAD